VAEKHLSEGLSGDAAEGAIPVVCAQKICKKKKKK
jgi:hypothetical protein